MSTITNADRAAWAEASLETFQALCGPNDPADAIGDLIIDLCHLERRRQLAAGGAAFDCASFLQARANMHDIEALEDPEE